MIKSVVLGISGASGAIYAKKFIELASTIEGLELHVIFTATAEGVWEHEAGISHKEFIDNLSLSQGCKARIELVDNSNFNHKYASGSNRLDSMVILPCSMGSLARIATGVSADLIGRIADVQLKERRRLVIVPREMPYSLIHLRNMTALTEAGAIICPASPSFYTKPASIEELSLGFAERIMDTAGIRGISERYRW